MLAGCKIECRRQFGARGGLGSETEYQRDCGKKAHEA
jgi:hypothetical protein